MRSPCTAFSLNVSTLKMTPSFAQPQSASSSCRAVAWGGSCTKRHPNYPWGAPGLHGQQVHGLHRPARRPHLHPLGQRWSGTPAQPPLCSKGHFQAGASAPHCHMLVINDCSQLIKPLSNLALSQRSPQQMPCSRSAPGRAAPGPALRADRAPRAPVVLLALFKQEG